MCNIIKAQGLSLVSRLNSEGNTRRGQKDDTLLSTMWAWDRGAGDTSHGKLHPCP